MSFDGWINDEYECDPPSWRVIYNDAKDFYDEYVDIMSATARSWSRRSDAVDLIRYLAKRTMSSSAQTYQKVAHLPESYQKGDLDELLGIGGED